MKKSSLLLTVLLFPPLVYLLFAILRDDRVTLPIYYPDAENVKVTIVDGKEITDTVYHTIPPFRFLNQKGDIVTESDFADKIYVADFFFSTCPSICPKMMTQMARVNKEMKDMNDFMIISHTVDPEHDSVEVLAEYAKQFGADPKKWMLVTGDRKEIYDIGVDGYKLAVDEDPRAPGGFLHSELFVLVDKSKRVRGIYDGTDSLEVNKLMNDIKVLAAEYISKNPKPKIYQKH